MPTETNELSEPAILGNGAENTATVIDVSRQRMTWDDIIAGFVQWRIWLMLAYQDIKLRYRRSVLGPFWLTISMAITVYSMGFLYARLFHTDLNTYYPHLVSGMLGWGLLSSFILELTDTFLESEAWIKAIKLPYSLYIHRLLARNLIIFSHNILVLIPIFFIFPEHARVNINTLALIPGLAILYCVGMGYGMTLAIIGARFRDISQIVKSLVQVAFFVTPVMWSITILPEHVRKYFYLNPFFSLLEIIRRPLIGEPPSIINLAISCFIAIVGLFISYFIFNRYRSRIIYWL